MRSLIVIGAIALTAGCATSAKYDETINSWVGSKEIDLIKSWSPPEETYEVQGSKFLIYSWSRSTEYGTLSCKTVFEVQQGIISSVKATGNDCTK